MKKNITTIILAVVCCATLVIAGFALHFGLYAKENIQELYSCYILNQERIQAVKDELDETIDLSEFNFEFGGTSGTHWSNVPVRQGQVEIEDGLRLLGFEKVIWTYNLEYTAPNYYEITNPTETAYVLVENTTTGVVALLNVVQAQ